MVGVRGIEPRVSASRTLRHTIRPHPDRIILPSAGVEPATVSLGRNCSSQIELRGPLTKNRTILLLFQSFIFYFVKQIFFCIINL